MPRAARYRRRAPPIPTSRRYGCHRRRPACRPPGRGRSPRPSRHIPRTGTAARAPWRGVSVESSWHPRYEGGMTIPAAARARPRQETGLVPGRCLPGRGRRLPGFRWIQALFAQPFLKAGDPGLQPLELISAVGRLGPVGRLRVPGRGARGGDLLLGLRPLLDQLLFRVAERYCPFEVLYVDGCLLVPPDLGNPVVQGAQRGRNGPADAQVPLDRAQPVVDRVQQARDGVLQVRLELLPFALGRRRVLAFLRMIAQFP